MGLVGRGVTRKFRDKTRKYPQIMTHILV